MEQAGVMSAVWRTLCGKERCASTLSSWCVTAAGHSHARSLYRGIILGDHPSDRFSCSRNAQKHLEALHYSQPLLTIRRFSSHPYFANGDTPWADASAVGIAPAHGAAKRMHRVRMSDSTCTGSVLSPNNKNT
eukprot:gene10369-biopygen8955